MKGYYLFNQDYASNKTGYLDNFLLNFKTTFKPMTDLLDPVSRVLEVNRAFIRVDPAVDLMSM